MNRSLVPLIISFAVIILLTFIVIYSKPGTGAQIEEENKGREAMTLNPFPVRHFSNEKKVLKQENSYAPNTESTIEKARLFLADGKEVEAEDLLRTLLIFEPENNSALSLLGGILYYSKKYGEAELVFRKQIGLAPEKGSYYNQLGSVMARQNKMEEAIKMSSKAVDLDPESADAQINLAGMYSTLSEREKANAHLLKAYQLIGYRILPFSLDSSFDNIRNTPEFQEITQKARQDWNTQILDKEKYKKEIPGKQQNGAKENRTGKDNPQPEPRQEKK